jgi:hypothetical protein
MTMTDQKKYFNLSYFQKTTSAKNVSSRAEVHPKVSQSADRGFF